MRVCVSIVAVIVLGAAAPAHAMGVELAGESWESEALAAALRADLASEPAGLVLRGEVRGGALHYAIARPAGAPVRGVIVLAGLDRQKLAGILRDQLHRVVRPEARAPDPPAELAAPAAGTIAGGLAALAVLAVVLAVPIGLARGRALRRRGTRRLAAVLGAIAVLAYALAVHGERVPEVSDWVYLVGGLAWGALAAVALPIALPPLAGLQRVESGELAGVLLAWLAAALRRTLVVGAVAAALGAVLWLVGGALGLPAGITFGVVAPLVALALGLAWRAVVELHTERLDAALAAEVKEPWHPHVRAYLVGYLRRANIDIDEELLERVQFVAGSGPDVAIYGGGLTHTRVVIPVAMLEHALAPYGRPHDYAMPRVSTLHWTHWNAGLVMPSEAGEKLATKEDRQPHDTVDEGEHARVALGEPPTLSGVIEPRAFDPRTHYRPTEDPVFLDWDPGEEYDGTDAGDRDFLFGLLVHALGVAQRREDRAAVFGWVRRLAAVHSFGASALGDVSVALVGARHHFAQYLAWQAWHRDDLVTARAHVPELEQTSRKIVAALAHDKSARLARLVPYLTGTQSEPRRRPRRRLALAVACVVGVGAVATLAVQAALYHPTYEARMKAEHERLEDGQRK